MMPALQWTIRFLERAIPPVTAFFLSLCLVSLRVLSPIHEAGHYWMALLRGQTIHDVGIGYVNWGPDRYDPWVLAAGPLFIGALGVFLASLMIQKRRTIIRWGRYWRMPALMLFFMTLQMVADGIFNLVPQKAYPQKDGSKIFRSSPR